MGKEWRSYLGCVLKPKSNENKKKKKTRKSQGLFPEQKNEGLDFSEEVDIVALSPAPPSPKPEVVLIEEATDRSFVIEAENENARNGHSASENAEDDEVKDRNSGIEVEKVDARDEHFAAKDEKDDHTTEASSVIEAENEETNNGNSDVKDEDDQARDAYSVIEVENVDAVNAHSSAKDADDHAIDRYSVIEPENEDARDPSSAAKDVVDDQVKGEYSVIEAENEESRNAHSTAKDANDQATDEHSVTEVENEDARNANSIVRDVEDDHTIDRDSITEAENEDAQNVHAASNDAEDDEKTDGYSTTEAENEHARDAHSTGKNAEDDQKTDTYSVIEADNMDARKAYSDVKVAEADEAKDTHSMPSQEISKVKSKEDIATIKIQSTFRGYLARRSFGDVKGTKGLMRLQSLVQAQFVKRQTTTTLKCMQTMAQVQRQVHARGIRMYEENQALQRQLQQKHDLDKSKSNMRDNWIDSPQSMEQIEANRQREQQAAIRRERELAYAYTHQLTWKSSPKQAAQALTEPDNPQWDWNWLQKRMGERPWDDRSIKKEQNSELPSAKSVTTLAQKVHHDLNLGHVKPSPMPRKQTRPPSPRRTPKSAPLDRATVPNSPSRSVHSMDGDDARSMQSERSARHRRHSGTKSSTRDHERQPSPRFMSPTTSAKAKSRLRKDNSGTPLDSGTSSATTKS